MYAVIAIIIFFLAVVAFIVVAAVALSSLMVNDADNPWDNPLF